MAPDTETNTTSPADAPQLATRRVGASALLYTFAGLFGFFALLVVLLVINARTVGLSNSFLAQMGLDPQQIQGILQIIVSASFGTLAFVLFLFVLTYLFRLLFLRQHTGMRGVIIGTAVSALLLVGSMVLWVVIYRLIGTLTVQAQLAVSADVVVKNTETGETLTPTNLVAPIALTFDATNIAKRFSVQKTEVLAYQWDLNGDGQYSANEVGNPITYRYEDKGATNGVFPVGLRLLVRDATGKEQTIDQAGVATVSIRALRPNIRTTRAIAGTLVAPAEVQIDASRTIDGDSPANTLAYTWTLGDKVIGTDAVLKYSFATAGTYDVVLAVADLDGNESTVTEKVEVAPSLLESLQASIRLTPESGGAPLRVTATAEVFVPDDRLRITRYEWDMGDGSIKKTGKVVAHTFTAEGDYAISLVLTDDKGNSREVERVLQVRRTTPAPKIQLTTEPRAKYDPRTGYTLQGTAPYRVTFDATRTTDADGNIASYEWDFDGDGANDEVGQKIIYTYDKGGFYTAKLTVKDNDGNSATEFVTVNVDAAPVTAALQAMPRSGSVPLRVTFDASASGSPEVPIIAYEWDMGDGKTFTTQTSSHTYEYTAVGSYTPRLTVRDANGGSTTTAATIVVTAVPTAPFFTASRTQGVAPLAVSFDATASTGSITSYSWDFGDGAKADGAKASHTYTVRGTYTATLTVRDTDNKLFTYTRKIEVK